MSGEWSLILYTLCIQAAVGIFVASRAVVAGEEEQANRMRFLWIVGGLGVAGVIASVLHLGNPMNAFRTMSNLATSWLSREILFTILFGLTGGLTLVLELKQIGSRSLRNGVAAVAALVGVGLVFVMSMIYRSFAFPAWAHLSTTASFLATTGLIGTAAVFAGQCMRRGEDQPKGLSGLVYGALAMLALQMVSVSSHAAYLGGAGKEAQMTAAMLSGEMALFFWARVALVVIGSAVVMPWVWRRVGTQNGAALAPVAGLLVALVTLGELLGRFLFYATAVKIGL